MTREQQLEKALRDLLMETSSYTVAAAMKVLNICTACNRDIDREGRCSLCLDGEKEKWAESGFRNTRIYDDE